MSPKGRNLASLNQKGVREVQASFIPLAVKRYLNLEIDGAF